MNKEYHGAPDKNTPLTILLMDNWLCLSIPKAKTQELGYDPPVVYIDIIN